MRALKQAYIVVEMNEPAGRRKNSVNTIIASTDDDYFILPDWIVRGRCVSRGYRRRAVYMYSAAVATAPSLHRGRSSYPRRMPNCAARCRSRGHPYQLSGDVWRRGLQLQWWTHSTWCAARGGEHAHREWSFRWAWVTSCRALKRSGATYWAGTRTDRWWSPRR